MIEQWAQFDNKLYEMHNYLVDKTLKQIDGQIYGKISRHINITMDNHMEQIDAQVCYQIEEILEFPYS